MVSDKYWKFPYLSGKEQLSRWSYANSIGGIYSRVCKPSQLPIISEVMEFSREPTAAIYKTSIMSNSILDIYLPL